MKLYLIRGSFDPKVIGRVEVTQSAGMTEGYNYAADNSVYNISGTIFPATISLGLILKRSNLNQKQFLLTIFLRWLLVIIPF